MVLPPEEMVWLTRYVACALPVLALLSLLLRRDPISLCFGLILFLASPVLLSAVAAVQTGSPQPFVIGAIAIASMVLIPAILLPALHQMSRAREDW